MTPNKDVSIQEARELVRRRNKYSNTEVGSTRKFCIFTGM